MLNILSTEADMVFMIIAKKDLHGADKTNFFSFTTALNLGRSLPQSAATSFHSLEQSSIGQTIMNDQFCKGGDVSGIAAVIY